MTISQNGYPALTSARTTGDLPRLRKWVIPGTGRHLYLRDGAAGFLLVHLALWFHENVEKINVGVWDEWGYSYRAVRGETVLSNHASGTAMDLDATLHPLGKRGTFRRWQYLKVRARLALTYRRRIRWGADYMNRADEMHFEINMPLGKVERRARKLAATARGKRILAANPGARRVIFS